MQLAGVAVAYGVRCVHAGVGVNLVHEFLELARIDGLGRKPRDEAAPGLPCLGELHRLGIGHAEELLVAVGDLSLHGDVQRDVELGLEWVVPGEEHDLPGDVVV